MNRRDLAKNIYNDWVGRDLSRILYIDRIGRSIVDMAFMCKVEDSDCRYRMKYTRGFAERGGIWGTLAELHVDKVAVRKEMREKKLEEEGL